MSKIVEKREEFVEKVKLAEGNFDELCKILKQVDISCADVVINAIVGLGCSTTNFLSALKSCPDGRTVNQLILCQVHRMGVASLEAARLYRRCGVANQKNAPLLYEEIFKASRHMFNITEKTSLAELKMIAGLFVDEVGSPDTEESVIETEKAIISIAIKKQLSAGEILSLIKEFNTFGGNRLIVEIVNNSTFNGESLSILYGAIKGNDLPTKKSILLKAFDQGIQPESVISTCPVIVINL